MWAASWEVAAPRVAAVAPRARTEQRRPAAVCPRAAYSVLVDERHDPELDRPKSESIAEPLKFTAEIFGREKPLGRGPLIDDQATV